MPALRVFDPDETGFSRPSDVYPAEVLPRIPGIELEHSRVRMHHPGGDDEPQLFEMELDPGLELSSHAHESPEIILVSSGELRLGRRILRPGCSVLIPGLTLYSVTAGPNGARFFNFRGSSDYTYIDRAEFAARRHEPQTPMDP